MNYQNLLFEVKNKIAFVTINRPDKLNALNHDTLLELKSCFEEIAGNDEIDVAVLTGAGEKAFVAGADISELNKLNESAGTKFALFGQEIFTRIEKLNKPVIAAINGFALGGGCELALACHIRIASDKAKFGQPEVNLGIIPGYGGTQRLARLVNTGLAAELILTGDLIGAEEALRIGLVNKVYPADQLISKTVELAEKISSKGQIAVGLSLQAIVGTNEFSEAEGLKLEAELFGKCCATEDFKEGISAFLEKRKPGFQKK